MWTVGNSHKWTAVPGTRTETKYYLDGARFHGIPIPLFNRKYLDIDTGKFDLDRIESIKSIAWADIIDHYPDGHSHDRWSDSNKYRHLSVPSFTPKDNDFDEEYRKDEELKRKQQEEIKKAQQDVDRIKLELEEKERQYQEYVKMREKQIALAKAASQPNCQYIITVSGIKRVA